MDKRTELDLDVERRLNECERRVTEFETIFSAGYDRHGDRLTKLEKNNHPPARNMIAGPEFDALVLRVDKLTAMLDQTAPSAALQYSCRVCSTCVQWMHPPPLYMQAGYCEKCAPPDELLRGPTDEEIAAMKARIDAQPEDEPE